MKFSQNLLNPALTYESELYSLKDCSKFDFNNNNNRLFVDKKTRVHA